MNGQSRDTGNIVYIRHRMKTNKTQKTKKTSNTDTTKNRGEPRCSRRISSSCVIITFFYAITHILSSQIYFCIGRIIFC
jgi:hypothetical protein